VKGERHRVNEDVIGLTLQEDDIGLSLPFLLRRNYQTMVFSYAVAAEAIVYDNVAENVVGLITK
jgi:hypothetical protein